MRRLVLSSVFCLLFAAAALLGDPPMSKLRIEVKTLSDSGDRATLQLQSKRGVHEELKLVRVEGVWRVLLPPCFSLLNPVKRLAP